MKRKAIIFYTYLPPWRIDVFNALGKLFNLSIVFLNVSSEGFTYNRERLSGLLNVPHQFWSKGIKIKGKVFRTGIYRHLKKEKPEVVFSHEYSPTSILLALFVKLGILKYSLIITTSDNLQMAKSVKGLKSLARKLVLSTANGVVVYSEEVKEFYSNTFPHLNVEVCPNIQDPKALMGYKKQFEVIKNEYEERYQLKESNIILFIGRLVDVKGLDLLIDAFGKSNNDEYKLIIVGEGAERDNLKQQINRLNLQNKVLMPGFFDGASLYAWYDLANFFVLPSRYEPFGAVVNESLVLGCPVIASKYIGAVSFIENGFNGEIFDPLKENEFVEVLNSNMRKFAGNNTKKENLMKLPFNDYINSFTKVLND